ncbi:hypothetical protein NQ314_019333 [Rhamnusium bicolor]|uniref:Uncharacterized protein n=1 Tax=Rhamnusium bicolor TaxID=1586634 RepID=A0AAV8WPN3_9CUCU|nr:hypothetical protein NQ314_019333 [Rhamnusium bicolor]
MNCQARHQSFLVGIAKPEPEKCINRIEFTQSLIDISSLKANTVQHNISPIPEGSRESSVIFKTPSAYERRSIARFTPKSVASVRRSLYHASTPLPSLNDLQKRLNDWLAKRGKSLSTFHHLKCFGVQGSEQEPIDDENKENIEVDEDLDKGSYEDLKISVENDSAKSKTSSSKSPLSNEENSESVAKAALEDLLKLIQEGYPRPQCEGWLELIRRKYQKLEEEPQYWECRAAIEQSRGNISNAVHCYKTAIVQGAEKISSSSSSTISSSLFSYETIQLYTLVDIITDDKLVENNYGVNIKWIVTLAGDTPEMFLTYAYSPSNLDQIIGRNKKDEDAKTLIATPVRRSTRLSRSTYTSTPGVKICSSLRDLGASDMEMIDFKKNKALF